MLIFSAFTAILALSDLAYAEANTKIKKNVEDYFAESYQCLKNNDKACAQIAAANIPSLSPYSKLLNGIFASLEGDFDTTFRELLPLQTNPSLSLQAGVSLHTSLALAYENQSDSLRALEQRILVDASLAKLRPINQEEINANQHQIWEIISVLSKANLTEMRGNSADTVMQGWIDLALAAKYQSNGESNQKAIAQWRLAYADHPAKETIAAQLFPLAAAPSADIRKAKLKGTVALLLPFSSPDFYPISDAIERGFTAAKKIANDQAEIKIYADQVNAGLSSNLYQQALNEGAQYVIGPITPSETEAVSNMTSPVTTLMLNKAKSKLKHPKQVSYGLFASDEVAQIINIARNSGMQTATVIASNNALNLQISQHFKQLWLDAGGQLSNFSADNNGSDIKDQLNQNPSDMIFIAAEAESARLIRAMLPTNIPTFGIAEIYSGIVFNAEDLVLKGVRFVDLPWMVDRENPKFSAYKEAATGLPAGEMQRWFALGADAYQILITLDRLPSTGASIDGLSGKIEINANGEITRSLANASFGAEGILLESVQ